MLIIESIVYVNIADRLRFKIRITIDVLCPIDQSGVLENEQHKKSFAYVL